MTMLTCNAHMGSHGTQKWTGPMTNIELWPLPLYQYNQKQKRPTSTSTSTSTSISTGTTRATTPGEPPLLQPLLMVTRWCIELVLVSKKYVFSSSLCQYFFSGGLFSSLCSAGCTWTNYGTFSISTVFPFWPPSCDTLSSFLSTLYLEHDSKYLASSPFQFWRL